MFISCPGRHLNVLNIFNLGCVFTWKGLPCGLNLKDQQDFHEFHLTNFSPVFSLNRHRLNDLQKKSVGWFLYTGNIGLIWKLFDVLKVC